MPERLTTEEFIERAQRIHKGIYAYDKAIYINAETKLTITCPIHGDFEQVPHTHLRGGGCQKCALTKKHRISQDDFLRIARNVHGDKYNYDKTVFYKRQGRIIITCPIHGDFEQLANCHLTGRGCRKCYEEARGKSTEKFVSEARKVHGDKYEYGEYIGYYDKIKIICPEHGEFYQLPNNHLAGRGCPKCHYSRGERTVKEYLIDNNILFEEQKSFDDLRNKGRLRYDFYLPEYRMLIEYNGKQHYEAVEFFGGAERFEVQKRIDGIKKRYAEDNGFRLLTISYEDDIIEALEGALGENKIDKAS